ncbi:alpha/beta-hydrolase [Daldinia caldariorum]|uniref:alpha/beta-hydrolase n=1 Tax=Daldinia caldariorum TaxID=326644 RepID=UPI00200874CC|nr:alpha/beta-hydrolase [Daldinia caldariorum]KAI1469341.1 alpha/beta-hydrolase [Daldinia caldariorum]
MSKPTILIVGGSFAPAEVYDDIVDAVQAKGYDIKALHHPSVAFRGGPRPEKLPTMYDDAALVANEISKLADEGKEVVLVSHSYGGVPASESTKGLTKKERQSQGKPGGVIRLAYMTALVPPVGRSAQSLLAELPPANHIEYKTDEQGWMDYVDISAAAPLIISDLPDVKEREALVARLQTHSSASFATELTHAGYKDVPVSYLLCEEDALLLPKYQREWIEFIEKETGNKVDVTSLQAGHCPNFTKPQETIDWIVNVAEKGGN